MLFIPFHPLEAISFMHHFDIVLHVLTIQFET